MTLVKACMGGCLLIATPSNGLCMMWTTLSQASPRADEQVFSKKGLQADKIQVNCKLRLHRTEKCMQVFSFGGSISTLVISMRSAYGRNLDIRFMVTCCAKSNSFHWISNNNLFTGCAFNMSRTINLSTASVVRPIEGCIACCWHSAGKPSGGVKSTRFNTPNRLRQLYAPWLRQTCLSGPAVGNQPSQPQCSLTFVSCPCRIGGGVR